MNKAPDAFRTISEVADDLDIPQHVLRFWETRFSSIRPLKRGGGRRYYRPDDVDLLKGIRQLLYGQGYTIKGVQRILKDGGPRAVQDLGRGGTFLLPGPVATPLGDEAFDEDDEVVSELEPPGHGVGHIPDAALPRLPAAPLGPEAGRRLRAALADLLECQRALETLRRR